MMIINAVNSAPTPTAVYFLVNAYMESLSHFKRTCGMPEHALDVPIDDPVGLRLRLDALEHLIGAQGDAVAPITELGAVICSALARLEALGEFAPAQLAGVTMYCVRNDSPHSSQSV
jgi:hypothetical protein